MAIYNVLIHHDAYGEVRVEAENEDEACEKAYEEIGSINFEGEYQIGDIVKIKDDKE